MPSPSQLLERWKKFAADNRVAIRDARGEHSRRKLNENATAIALALLNGAKTLGGERVALLVSPGAAFVEAFFGVLYAGGTVIVLSPLHPLAETNYFCDDAKITRVLVSSDLRDRLNGLTPARTLLDVEDLASRPTNDEKRALPFIAGDAPALQLYTSGTTGKPKGAVITHENLGVQQSLLAEAWGWSIDDILLHALPLHHLHGLGIALLTALGAGASAKMLPFDGAAVWDAMASCTVFMGVPTMYTKLFAAFDAASDAQKEIWRKNARGLRLATSGSAALPVTLATRWKEIAGAFPLERFGMTEIGVGFSNPLAGERRPGTIGKALPTVDVRIVGDDGNDAEQGELWIAGPSVFTVYFERPEATRDAFVEKNGTRWFKTGDMVLREPDGYVRILGRTSVDILKSGGYKLSALEIEEALREHAGVAEAAVIGVPDETWGERVVACIIVRPGKKADCSPDILRSFLKEKLASYKVPKDYVYFDELPRNAIGKVLKPELKKLVAPSPSR